jgi:hypothetical protein
VVSEYLHRSKLLPVICGEAAPGSKLVPLRERQIDEIVAVLESKSLRGQM